MALCEHIRGLLRFGLCDARHVPHLCIQEKIFVKMALVHEKPVNAKLLKGHYIVFP